jgi:flavorubredoxin
MKALVVYESFWGNTKATAQAIAEGIGGDTPVLPTDEATPEALAGVDLLVVGSPLMGFALPTAQMRTTVSADKKAPAPADVSHPSMRDWLGSLPEKNVEGAGGFAAFETGFRWSPGSAKGTIARGLTRAGYRQVAKSQRFRPAGTYGPMQEGELERARAWGGELAKAVPS